MSNKNSQQTKAFWKHFSFVLILNLMTAAPFIVFTILLFFNQSSIGYIVSTMIFGLIFVLSTIYLWSIFQKHFFDVHRVLILEEYRKESIS